MKKTISAIICIFALLFVSSCGNGGTDNRAFTRGKVENNVYQSVFAGLKFSPGPSWSFASADEMLSQNGINKQGLTEDDINDYLNDLDTIYDMVAENVSSGIKVTVIFENFKHNVGGEAITTEDYIFKLKSDLESAYAADGAAVSIGSDEQIGGSDYKSVYVILSRDSSEIEQVYYIREIEGYFMSLCITAPASTDIVSDLLIMFDLLD